MSRIIVFNNVTLDGVMQAPGRADYAEKTNLIRMEPQDDLSSTGYVLANPGIEYLVRQPEDTDDPFTLTLDAGEYDVEWFHVHSRKTKAAGRLKVKDSSSIRFSTPFEAAGPVILYLKGVNA